MKKIFLMLIIAMPMVALAQKQYSEAAKAVFSQANTAYNNGNSTEAFALYEKCVGMESSYAEAYVNMSVIKFEAKDYANSLKYALKGYSIEKVQYGVFSQLGKSYYMNNRPDSAAFYLNRIKVFQSLNDQENYFLASSWVLMNESVSAKPIAEDLTTRFPNNSDYTILLGNVHFGMGEYDKAMTAYEKSLVQNPDNVYVYSNVANSYLKLDKPAEALTYIDKGIKTTSGKNKVAFLILKGNYYHSVDDLDNAEKAFDEAYGLDNTNANILVNQAGVLIDRENYQSAFEKCNQAIEKDNELMEAYYNRGIANEMLRNVEAACSDWEEAFILGSEKAEKFLNSPTCNE